MNFMSGESAIGILLFLVLYTGAGAGLFGWLTRSRADARRESREALSKNLGLIEAMDKLRGTVTDPARLAELDEMRARLLEETTRRVTELNNIETDEVQDPAKRFLLLPPPQTAWGVILAMIFAISAYFSVFALILIGVFLSEGSLNVFEPEGLEWTLAVVALSIGLGVLAAAARALSFGAYRSYVRRQQQARTA